MVFIFLDPFLTVVGKGKSGIFTYTILRFLESLLKIITDETGCYFSEKLNFSHVKLKKAVIAHYSVAENDVLLFTFFPAITSDDQRWIPEGGVLIIHHL